MPVPYHLTLGPLYILYFHIYFRSSLAMHIQIKKTNSGILLADALTAEMNQSQEYLYLKKKLRLSIYVLDII